MNTRMFKNGFQSAMILVVVAILGLAGGTLVRDLLNAPIGKSEERLVADKPSDDEASDNVVSDNEASSQTSSNTQIDTPPEKPQFDILRVEKDGAVLVAGRTQPNSDVEVKRSTGEILGKVKAKGNGDFVLTLKAHLTRGEHIMNLTSTDQDGAKTVSVQTGVVFIPGESGEVLALISQDGKASRVATKPDSLKSDKQQVATLESNSDEMSSNSNAALDNSSAAIEKFPILVEAVEVEGQNIFVAGAVAPAALVRIYIDNVPVGSARGTADHRFLLEKKFDLAEGEHIVRADVINEKTGGVWSRVVVDLKHEVPKELLNVAGEKGTDLKPGDVSNQASSTKTNNGATQVENTEQAKTDASKTELARAGEPIDKISKIETIDNVKQPTFVETTTTVIKTANVEAAQSGSEKAEVVSNAADVNTNTTDTKAAPPAVPKKLEVKESKSSETVVPKLADTEVLKEAKVQEAKNSKTVVLKKTEADGAKSSGPVVPKNLDSVKPKMVETAATETIEVTKIQTGRSVIIKWGDSLWRISRRTYGRGIRYTTIYNANRSQISDPNRIYVGQVFKLPENADL